jgi:hypothetical protein
MFHVEHFEVGRKAKMFYVEQSCIGLYIRIFHIRYIKRLAAPGNQEGGCSGFGERDGGIESEFAGEGREGCR